MVDCNILKIFVIGEILKKVSIVCFIWILVMIFVVGVLFIGVLEFVVGVLGNVVYCEVILYMCKEVVGGMLMYVVMCVI